MNAAVTCLVLALSAFSPLQTDPDAQFTHANELFTQGEFAEAAQEYESIIGSGVRAPALEYNLGAAYYRLHQVGLSRLHFERALRLNPRFEDARFNIDFIEQRFLKSSLREDQFSSIDRLLWRAVTLYPPALSAPAALISFVVLNLLFALRIIAPRALGPALRWTLLIGLSVVTAVSLFAAVTAENLTSSKDYGVVVSENVDVTSEPSLEAPSRFPAPPAMKVVISRRQGDWLEIMLPNGSKGWVNKSALEII